MTFLYHIRAWLQSPKSQVLDGKPNTNENFFEDWFLDEIISFVIHKMKQKTKFIWRYGMIQVCGGHIHIGDHCLCKLALTKDTIYTFYVIITVILNLHMWTSLWRGHISYTLRPPLSIYLSGSQLFPTLLGVRRGKQDWIFV